MKILLLSLLFITGFGLPKKSRNHLFSPLQADSTFINLKNEKNAIDQYIKLHRKSVVVLVKIPGKKNLVVVKNEHWPDEVEYTCNIYKNASGKIIFIALVPFSESGDWYIEYDHYFDEGGNTLAFSKEESIFDNNVKGGVVREILSIYYDKNFKKIRQNTGLTDKDGKTIRLNKSSFDFRHYKYSIFKNLNECFVGYGIKLSLPF